MEEVGDGGVEDGVVAGQAVGFGHIHFDVGGYAKFGDIAFSVANYRRREAHAPAVGQFAGEWQSATAASGVADDGDIGELLHD